MKNITVISKKSIITTKNYQSSYRYVSICLEHFIVGTGETYTDSLRKLEDLLYINNELDLEKIKKAPQKYWDMLKTCKKLDSYNFKDIFHITHYIEE